MTGQPLLVCRQHIGLNDPIDETDVHLRAIIEGNPFIADPMSPRLGTGTGDWFRRSLRPLRRNRLVLLEGAIARPLKADMER